MEAENDRQEEGKIEKEDEQKGESGEEEAEGMGEKEDQEQVIKIGTANVKGALNAKKTLFIHVPKSNHIMALQEIQIEDQKDMCNIAGYKILINVGSKKGNEQHYILETTYVRRLEKYGNK